MNPLDGPLLVPVDGSEPAEAALDHAIDVAAGTGAAVHLLYVADTNEESLVRTGGAVEDVLETEGEEILEAAEARATDRGVTVRDRVIQGDPNTVIPRAAEREDAAAVVMGSHGRTGVRAYLLGSTTESVTNACSVPVMTVREGEDCRRRYPYQNVLVPTDGSEHAEAAVELGARVAAGTDATLHVLFVADELPETVDADDVHLSDAVRDAHREILETGEAIAADHGVDAVTAIESGSVPREVVSYAEEGIDLVVMGTHGRSGLDRRSKSVV